MNGTLRKEYSDDKDLKRISENIKYKAEGLESCLLTLPHSRDRSLALTKLEECVMWAVKGIYN